MNDLCATMVRKSFCSWQNSPIHVPQQNSCAPRSTANAYAILPALSK